jgi:hypothetical protein
MGNIGGYSLNVANDKVALTILLSPNAKIRTLYTHYEYGYMTL